MQMRRVLHSGIFIVLIQVASLLAESRLVPLTEGMSTGEVVRLWGVPTERIEQEVKREKIFIYRGGRVKFSDDKVLEWVVDGDRALPSTVDTLKQGDRPSARPAKDVNEVDRLLEQLVQELPDEEGAAAKAPKPSGRLPFQPELTPIQP